jgi:Domain of unknown function (DUF4919)
MLRRLFCCLLLILAVLLVYPQTTAAPPFNYKKDFKTLLHKTQEPDSEFFYNKLLVCFLERDTTLSKVQVLMLMIGYTADPHYKPLEDMETEQQVFDLNEAGKYEGALMKGKPYLQTHPLSLRVLQEVSFCYHALKKEDSATYYMDLADKIMGAMIFSGKGKTPEDPIFSLGLADGEYFIPNIGMTVEKKGTDWNKDNHFMEIIEASKNIDEHDIYYFVIEHAKEKIDGEKVTGAPDKKGPPDKKAATKTILPEEN